MGGCIQNRTVGGNFYYHASGRGSPLFGFSFNASISSAIYGASNTIRPVSKGTLIMIRY